jgi:methionyl-tRNA formyltransferase
MDSDSKLIRPSHPHDSVVLLTGTRPEQRFVAACLWKQLGDRLGAVIVESDPRESAWSRLVRTKRRYTYRQMASRLYWRLWRRVTGRAGRDRKALYAALFGTGLPQPLPDDLVQEVPDHNGPQCLALLRKLEPAIIVIFGTRIIRPPVMALAGEVVLNLHTGISPRYRGASSVFWAIHNEEPEWIGSTVHVLDVGVDSGAILGVARPEISPEDNEATLFGKCVQVGADLLADHVRAVLRGELEAEAQDLNLGRQYRFIDRTVSAERKVERLLREGLLENM